jgi:hypothetical protein
VKAARKKTPSISSSDEKLIRRGITMAEVAQKGISVLSDKLGIQRRKLIYFVSANFEILR